MKINLEDNGLTKFLSSEFKEQLPFAQSQVLNSTAFETMGVLRKAVNSHLKTTRKFLESSIQVQTATKKKLIAEVGFLDRVYFADILLDGGVRTPYSSKYIAVPMKVKRSKRGAITKANRPEAILKKKNYFMKTVNGDKYIFKRLTGGRIEAQYVLKKRVNYKKSSYFPFDDIVMRHLMKNNNYEDKLIDALEKAFKTRRR